MFKVADTIRYRREWLRHHPELPPEEGLLVVLEGDHARTTFQSGVRVKVLKPDGSSTEMEVAKVRVNPDGVVGLFFREASDSEIPRGSLIQSL